MSTSDSSWKHHGRHDAQPVPGHFMVDVRFRDGGRRTNIAAYLVEWDYVIMWRPSNGGPGPARPQLQVVPKPMTQHQLAHAVRFLEGRVQTLTAQNIGLRRLVAANDIEYRKAA